MRALVILIFAIFGGMSAAQAECITPSGPHNWIAEANEQGDILAPIKGGGRAFMTGAPPCGRLVLPLDFPEVASCKYAVGHYDNRDMSVCARQAKAEEQSLEAGPAELCKHRVVTCQDPGFVPPKGPKFDMPQHHAAHRHKKREASQW
ncbi:MAG TPA: hypothetical protein VN495_03015 [Candidatus Paceibacterota bacterium]|nr:hypothetical protein [Candidatus Paceibacterota bacterium]